MLPYKGVYAVPSEGIDRGFQVALAEYGNSVAGRRIEVVRADDELTPNVGVQQFNRLVQLEKVDLVAGVVSSSVGICRFGPGRQGDPAACSCERLRGRDPPPSSAVPTSPAPRLARTGFSITQENTGRATASALPLSWARLLGGTFVPRCFQTRVRGRRRQGRSGNLDAVPENQGLGRCTNPGQQFRSPNHLFVLRRCRGPSSWSSSMPTLGSARSLPLVGDHWIYDQLNSSALGDLMVGPEFITTYLPTAKTEANEKFVARYREMFQAGPGSQRRNSATTTERRFCSRWKSWAARCRQISPSFIATMRSLVFDSPRGKTSGFNATNSALLEKVYVVKIKKDQAGNLVSDLRGRVCRRRRFAGLHQVILSRIY